MPPWLVVEQLDGTGLRGTAPFGRYYLGSNGAVHGGAVSLVFDEILGQAARTPGRSWPAPLTCMSSTARSRG